MSNIGWEQGDRIAGVVGDSHGGYRDHLVSYAIHDLILPGGEKIVVMQSMGPLTKGTRLTATISTGRLQRASPSANENHILEIIRVCVQPSAAILAPPRPGIAPQSRL